MSETYTADYHRVKCPYCGEPNDMAESIGTQGESLDSWDCDDCGKEFRVRIHFSVTVTAETLEEREEREL